MEDGDKIIHNPEPSRVYVNSLTNPLPTLLSPENVSPCLTMAGLVACPLGRLLRHCALATTLIQGNHDNLHLLCAHQSYQIRNTMGK